MRISRLDYYYINIQFISHLHTNSVMYIYIIVLRKVKFLKMPHLLTEITVTKSTVGVAL